MVVRFLAEGEDDRYAEIEAEFGRVMAPLGSRASSSGACPFTSRK